MQFVIEIVGEFVSWFLIEVLGDWLHWRRERRRARVGAPRTGRFRWLRRK